MAEDTGRFPVSVHEIESTLQKNMAPQDTRRTFRVVGPLVTTATSRIYQAFHEGSNHPVAVKCTTPEEAREQFAALAKVEEHLADWQDCRSPSPIALLEADGIIVMDWINAPSFQTLCLALRTPLSSIESAIGRCATLLARLHTDAAPGSRVLDTADFLNDIALAFDGRSPPDALKPAIKLLEATAGDVHRLDLPVAILHGDFKSANLLIEESTTWTIDATMRWQGATVHDIAHFLNQFALDLYHPRGLRLRRRLNSLEQMFITACEANSLQVSLPALRWLRLQKLVILYAEQHGRKSARLAARYLLWCLRFEVNRIIQSFPK